MSIIANRGVRAARRLVEVAQYAVPKSPHKIDIWLNGNEGLAPPGELLRYLGSGTELLRRYPSLGALESRLAQRFGLPDERVLVTAGADDALYRACLALLDEGREIILPIPTFEMLDRYARLAGSTVVTTPWLTGTYPADAVIDAVSTRTAIIAVVSPNNPTGTVASVDQLRRLSSSAPHALLVVDLAYTEFADVDLTEAALELPNALVIRTLSKAWGLAGLRVGYAMGPAEVIRWLRCVGNPYAVSSLSAALAEAWLKAGEDNLKQYVVRVRQERTELIKLLCELGAEPMHSQGNFILARFLNAEMIWGDLARLGIAVRSFPGDPILNDYLRITCPGEPAVFARLTQALRQVLGDTTRCRS